jgi:DNA-binding response OmpR family regulator
MGAPRILVADDDAWILRMVTTVLEKRGYAVETATDGEEAYEKAVASPPDLLITDVMMPKMDGWALVKALRSRARFAFVPVIFLTALGSDDDRIRGFRLGADDYLPKPFRFEELDLRVAKTLRRRQTIEEDTREQIGGGGGGSGVRADSAGIAGELTQVGLSALLTLLEMERKGGVLTLTGPDQTVAHIYLRNGRVIKAGIDNRESPANADCIYFLLTWATGAFQFNASEVEGDDEVGSSTTSLLMEGARRLDEARRDAI